MAKIFWNEIVAMVLSCGILTLLFYFNFKEVSYLFAFVVMIGIAFSVTVFYDNNLVFLLPYSTAAIVALSTYHHKVSDSPIPNTIFCVVMFFVMSAIILIVVGKERKAKDLWRILYSVMFEYATLMFILGWLINSWKISLTAGIIGIAIMAAIAFFPSGYRDFKPHFPGQNGLPG